MRHLLFPLHAGLMLDLLVTCSTYLFLLSTQGFFWYMLYLRHPERGGYFEPAHASHVVIHW